MRPNSQGSTDFIALLLKSLKEEDEKVPVEDREIVHSDSFDKQRGTLTRMEMLAQCMIFLMAGNDTTSNTLALMLFHFAHFPAIQDKVRQEVLAVVGSDATISAGQASRLVYIEQVMNEVLRLYPQATR